MSSLLSFKHDAEQHGQDITIYSFVAYPTGAYVDTWSGEPDPDSGAYPVTQPDVSYAAPVTVKGFYQPVSTTKKEEYVRAPWGEEVRIAARAMVPGDQAVSHRDKVEAGSETFYVVQIAPWQDSGLTVYTEVALTEKVPRA